MSKVKTMKVLKIAFVVISLISVAGCQPALMNIDVPEMESCPACECELPPVPAPIPETVRIYIDEDMIDMDEGGQSFIYNYLDVREQLQQLWQDR